MVLQYANPPFHVIIIMAGAAQYIDVCLNAVYAQTLPAAQVTVFSDGAWPETIDRVAYGWPAVRLMRSPRRLGYAAGHNRAAAAVREADFLMLLDADVVPALDMLEQLADSFAHTPKAGVLGCKMLDRDVETLRHVGVRLTHNGLPSDIGRGEPDRGQYLGLREVPAVQSGALAVRMPAWRELGGFDENLQAAYYDGLDLCGRAWAAGWNVAVDCRATVTHFNPWTPRRGDRERLELFFRNRAHFLRKHYAPGQWLTRYLGGELRWLADAESRGMRAIALRTLWEVAVLRRAPTPPDQATFGVG